MNRFQRWRLGRQLRRDYQEWSQGHARPMIIAPDHRYVAGAMRTAMDGERRRIAGAIDAWPSSTARTTWEHVGGCPYCLLSPKARVAWMTAQRKARST